MERFSIIERGRGCLSNRSLSAGFLVGYVLHGSFVISVDGSDGRLYNAGQAFAMRVKEGSTVRSSERNTIVYFHVKGSLAHELFELYEVDDLRRYCRPSQIGVIFRVAEGEPDIKNTALFLHRTLGILCEMEENCEEESSNVDEVRAYLDASIYKRVRLHDLGAIFYISKTQIHRLFVKKYGVSPMQYFMGKKIEAAKEMLLKTDMNITEIAEKLCFSDYKHFTNTFKKHTEVMPLEFRAGLTFKD